MPAWMIRASQQDPDLWAMVLDQSQPPCVRAAIAITLAYIHKGLR